MQRDPDLTIEGESGAELEQLADLLTAASFTTEDIRRTLEVSESVEQILSNTARYSLFYSEELENVRSPAAVLALLYLFGCRVRADQLAVLPAPLLAILRRRNFLADVAESPGATRGTVAITELRSRYFLSDRLLENAGDDGFIPTANAVDVPCMPPHGSSMELLASLLPTNGSFLDVGCGSGCISILTGSRYTRIGGFDLEPRAVAFARANAKMNRVIADYTASDHASYQPSERYDHCAFNTPNAAVAWDFLSSTVDRLLNPGGVCQLWVMLPVTRDEGTAEGTLRARVANHERFAIEIAALPNSPFACSRESFAQGKLPANSLVVGQPSEAAAYLSGLRKQGVVEVACCVFTVRRRSEV